MQLVPSKPQYQPGEAASYTIKASDASGKPIAAEFSLGVVDEAIYAIKPDTVAAILNAFYGKVYSQVSTETSLSYYFNGQAGKRKMQLANVRSVEGDGATEARAPGAAEDPQGVSRHRLLGRRHPHRQQRPGDGELRLSRRHHFVARDHARCHPGHQGRQRGENTIVRKNIMVRLVVPRFFRRGDEITLSTIVQNYLPADKTAQVSMQFDGLQVLDGAQRNVNVPTRGLVKVDYRVRVLDVDSAKVLGKALTDVESDAMELTLPVVPLGVKLAISKSGSFAGAGTSDTSQPLTFPPARSRARAS